MVPLSPHIGEVWPQFRRSLALNGTYVKKRLTKCLLAWSNLAAMGAVRGGKKAPISASCVRQVILAVTAFLLGCAAMASFIIARAHEEGISLGEGGGIGIVNNGVPSGGGAVTDTVKAEGVSNEPPPMPRPVPELAQRQSALHSIPTSHPSILDGVRILVAIASFDFQQFIHLEEVLDGYMDMCAAGARVDVVVHETQPWSVATIDLMNTRLTCHNPSPNAGFTLTVSLRSPSMRLNLVDCHRKLFYDRLEDYDVFIFSEDDLRVTPKTVAAYLHETAKVQQLVGGDFQRASEFNVGIVRYEYNFPPNVVIDDKTRHASLNTTRVYWEHSWRPPIPKSVDFVPQKELSDRYVHMQNHHQGMFIATRELLRAWRTKPGCQFDKVRQRPGMKNKPSQPVEGTQRVWMSSQMLHGSKHCNVQQVIPIDNFGQLNVLHLPNKNYRRVGKKGRLGGYKEGSKENVFGDGHEVFEGPDPSLLQALFLHLEIRRRLPVVVEDPPKEYTGIKMVDDIERDGGFHHQSADYKQRVEKRLKAFQAYAARGGVMLESDMVDER